MEYLIGLVVVAVLAVGGIVYWRRQAAKAAADRAIGRVADRIDRKLGKF